MVQGVAHAPLNESPGETVARLTGLPEGQCTSRTALARAAGCDVSALVGVLRVRGDHGVAQAAALLPV